MQAGYRLLFGFLEHCSNNEIDLEDLEALGCDGTALNTGKESGVLRRFELHLERPLQRIVCLLHTNELPLRKLFRKLDGETTGPTTFRGPIGKRLHQCDQFLVQEFEIIPNDEFPTFDDTIRKDLSRDQKYLLNICNVIRGSPDGRLDDALNHKIGPLCHSRWLTTANRILRLYLSTLEGEDYYENLQIVTKFIIIVYAPMWFHIKCNPLIKDSAKHFFKMVKLSRYLPVQLRLLVDKSLTTNYLAGHCESLLTTMIADPQKKDRAIQIIKQIRERHQENYQWMMGEAEVPRVFEAPNFRFNLIESTTNDDQYDQLIDLDKIDQLTEPPITMKVPDDELETFEVPAYPCHTQATERCIRLVSEASQRVIGQERRHGLIVNTMYSRSINGEFESKRDYKCADLDELIQATENFKKQRRR